MPLHRPVSRAMQLGIATRAIDPVVACICGRVPFRGPFAIAHECVAQVVALGDGVSGLSVGQTVVVPWAVSCGRCDRCRAGLTSKCAATTTSELAAYLASGTRVPLRRMYATDATLHIGVSHARAALPDLLAFIARTGFPAEDVSTLTDDWDDAPTAYLARTTKVVLARDRLTPP